MVKNNALIQSHCHDDRFHRFLANLLTQQTLHQKQMPRRLSATERGIALFHHKINLIHRVPEKVSHLIFDNDFGKCGPIFKILSPGDS